jgi:acetyltransferase-like isoleucine patch superfamily enzyme
LSIIAAGSAVSGYIVRPGTYVGVPAKILIKNDFKRNRNE